MVKRLVSAINQFNRWVDIVFPELRQVFKDITAKGGIATLRLFPSPTELCSKSTEEIMTGWRSLMKRQPGLKKANLLLHVANKSVGTRQALEAYKFKNELSNIPFAKKLLMIRELVKFPWQAFLARLGI